MKSLMELKTRRARALEDHSFIRWLREPTTVSVEQAFDFMPVMALFIMGFRDMNLWVIRFRELSSEHFRTIINGNTLEDETHSRLFLEDWRKLRMDEKLGWSASDTLSWLFLSPDLEPFRRYQVAFVELAVDDRDDPMLRFAHSEAGEACGHVFFRASVHPADALRQATGEEYRYFGRYHLDRELGHVMESEGEFETQVLDPVRRAATLELGDRMFDIFDGIFDAFHRYVTSYVEPGIQPVPDAPIEGRSAARAEPKRTFDRLPIAKPHPSTQSVLDLIDQRMTRAAAHPFYRWLDEAPFAPSDKLRGFLPMWCMDVLGYRDLQHYVFRYEQPETALQHLINGWVTELSTHSGLFLHDWRALGLDELLGWGAEQTLEFAFLDRGMDVHRRNIFAFIEAGLRNPDPVLRFWLMYAPERSGDAFFRTTKRLAEQAEREGIGPLDYLADRHERVHIGPRGTIEMVRASFFAEPLTLDERLVAGEMIGVVFDALEEQLELSLEAVETNRFDVPGLLGARLASK